jgi:hypothetical protein
MSIDQPVRIVPFAPEYLDAVKAFSEQYYGTRPRSEAFYRWRYLEFPAAGRMFLALAGEACVGTLCALPKRYRFGGESMACLEVFDWHALPHLRGSGAGLRLMRAMMKQPERILAVHGTADTLKTLTAMGWQRLTVARAFELPLTGEPLAARFERSLGIPRRLSARALGMAIRAWFRPRHRAGARGVEVSQVDPSDPRLADLAAASDPGVLVQVPDPGVLRWLTSHADVGRFTSLGFHESGRLIGWALVRVWRADGAADAQIVELLAPAADAALKAWMVAEAACAAAASRPRHIAAWASDPALQEGLRANRFRERREEIPVFTWPKGLGATRAHVTLNHSDYALLPYGPAPPGETEMVG